MTKHVAGKTYKTVSYKHFV